MMIRNERHYRIIKAALAKFQTCRDQIDSKSDRPAHTIELEKNSFDRKISDLQNDLEEYDRLKAGKIPIMEILSINDLPEALIKARIALGLSQKELAQKVGLKEQQIQRYEHTDYESAKLSRIKEIFDALSSEKTKQNIPESDYDLQRVFKKLRKAGLDKDFIETRLMPEQTIDVKEIPEKVLCLQAASRAERIFGWSQTQILSREPLVTESVPARFKIAKKHNKPKLGVHTKYAHYIAGLLSRTTRNLDEKAIPGDADGLRKAVLRSSQDITFKGILEYVWKMGIPVIALGRLSFHAATIKNDGRNIIVLTQKTRSEARWMFNLLHELYHVINGVEKIEFEDYIRDLSEEEQAANRFAHTVLLQNGEELYDACLEESRTRRGVNPAYLKRNVKLVAERNGVRVGALANYVAYRLSSDRSDNWWGTAHNLQEPTDEMRAMISDAVLENAELDLLDRPDQELMLQVLRTGDEP